MQYAFHMSTNYSPAAIEAKWQKLWNDAEAYRTNLDSAKKPYYSLVMFPYPSGDKLHVGHWYNFAPADSYARFMRLKGHTVFSPMGFDAFGLPAENYAIKTGIHPSQSIHANVETMIAQLKRIGCMYDWSRMVNTSQPDYYKWTQWLFLKMYEHGLCYKKKADVNWCVSCQTVLANEQAQDGHCERCGTAIEKRPLEQWFWRIKDYAQTLLDGLHHVDWPEKTKLMQTNWIGRSEGTEVTFSVEGDPSRSITVFTTRVDTLFSAAFLVLAPEHPLAQEITTPEMQSAVEAYRSESVKKADYQRTDISREKTGVFTGAYVVNPINGERIPVWVGDFVLAHYGFGAVFGDAHDERDFVFAKKYDIPLKTTVRPADGSDDSAIRSLHVCFTDDGILYDSEEFSGLTSSEARKRITARLEEMKKGKGVVTYRLRDWLISRQRYWGAPIPIVYDPSGNPHPIPREHLPWVLPTDVEFKPTGHSPLRDSKEFIARTESIFGKGWRPEYDTMDTFVCSSFYYLRYITDANADVFVDETREQKWMPVHMYIGGPEHACMHLIYSRFVMHALKDAGIVSNAEPFQRLVHQGLITNKGAKMSKSKGNVVSPDQFVDTYGADVFRLFLMFMGPFTEGGDWSDTGIRGVDRFAKRLWRLYAHKVNASKKEISVEVDHKQLVALHTAIKRVTESLESLHFNTAISALMTLLNALEDSESIDTDTAQTVAILLSPLAPHLAEELFEMAGGKPFVIDQEWPTHNPALLTTDSVTVVVQVNGKVRGSMTIPSDAAQEEVVALALSQENVRKYIPETGAKKTIYIPKKLVSIVV